MTHFAPPEFALAVRTLAAFVFAWAAVGKFRHLTVLRGVVSNYRLLPDALTAPVAYALPPVEAGIAVALPWGRLSPWPEAAAAALLLVFAAAIAINIGRGRRDIDCGCFQSTLKQSLSWPLVLRNAVLAIALALAAAAPPAPPDGALGFEGIVAGGVAFLILQSLNILWSIVPAWRRPPRLGMGVRP